LQRDDGFEECKAVVRVSEKVISKIGAKNEACDSRVAKPTYLHFEHRDI
jgi:hypothetical protein